MEDAVIGTVLAAGTAGMNVARNGVLAAGLPATVAAQTMDRQCASGLMAIATAAKQVMVDGMQVVVAGGQENITAVQKPYFDAVTANRDPAVERHSPHAYMPMLQTAEFVARKYGISREAQDAFALESQRRTALAQELGRFDREIVPFTATMAVADKATGAVSLREVTLQRDEGNRPDTTLDGVLRDEGRASIAARSNLWPEMISLVSPRCTLRVGQWGRVSSGAACGAFFNSAPDRKSLAHAEILRTEVFVSQIG